MSTAELVAELTAGTRPPGRVILVRCTEHAGAQVPGYPEYPAASDRRLFAELARCEKRWITSERESCGCKRVEWWHQ